MGEQACLRRSFSHPSSASRETKEGNPIRGLTESISFGRFMSEPLAWEKWSTFSHNRYLEEAEKFSKPGSVAQMKAYFEAHYKNRVAKKTVALPGQQNASTVNIHETENAGKADPGSSADSKSTVATSDNKQQNKGVFDSKPTHVAHANTFCLNGQRDLSENANQSDTSSPMDSKSVMSKGDNKQQVKGVLDARPTYFAPANGFDLNGQTDLSENAQMEGCDNVKGESFEFESPPKVETPRQLENSENNNKWTAATGDKMPQKEAAEKENAALPANKRRMNFSSKLSSQTKASKVPKSSANQASVYGESKSPSSIHPSSEERSCSNSSNPSGSKAQCPITSSPFSLKCEERAVRRKEFFKKLEEKNKEAEKMHLQVRY
uniref:Uncharacterized protein MANES_12G017400 n=1 Tax=Rhizophora mucronata TaxID=61149 RepID=A0A2P2K116_RHIMU